MPSDTPSQITEYDRNTALERLQEAFAEGHISYEEMDERLQTVLTAQTHDDLVSVLASLPAMSTSLISEISAMSGRIQRRGVWRVPRVLKVESAYGRVNLDLSRAIIEHPVVDIELQLPYGRAKITLPRDAVVDFEDLRTVWKHPVYKPRSRAQPGGPRIRISGTMGYGRLKIRHRRR
jgi:Domain of unknown function (DUF1707)